MPFFRSSQPSREARKKYDDLLTHYQRDLDTINCWNFSNCELNEVPAEVLEWANMLNKKGLILSHNSIHRITEKVFTEPMDRLMLLDLSFNNIKYLSASISNLSYLIELDLTDNKLDSLPDLSKLQRLQVLSVKQNRFLKFPETITQVHSLRKLDISNNNIAELPQNFSHLLRLKVFEFSSNPITSKFRGKGIHDIMVSLNPFTEYEYVECYPDDFDRKCLDDSVYVKRVLERSASDVQTSDVEQVWKKQLQEQDEMISRHLEQQKEEQRVLLQTLTKMEALKKQELEAVSREMESQRSRWVRTLLDLEEQTRKATEELVVMHQKLQEASQTSVMHSDERKRQEQLAAIQTEEYRRLETDSVQRSMELQLREMMELQEKAKDLDIKRDYHSRKILNDINTDSRLLDEYLFHSELEKAKVISDFVQNEVVQKKLVQEELMAQDVKRSQLVQQVELIEKQLLQMTVLEMRKRDMQSEEDQQLALKADRQKLSQLWAKVQEEKMVREKEILKLLEQMEQQKQNESDQYWLVQYQRLLSSKPVSIASKEFDLDTKVVKLMNKCGASHYLPLFAKHRITYESLNTLNDENLRLMGMSEIGLRATVLSAIDEVWKKRKHSLDSGETIDIGKSSRRSPVEPVAPPTNALPSTIRLENECCICLERNADLVFFPCGHVCCCSSCGVDARECPLCRSPIHNTVLLQFSTYTC